MHKLSTDSICSLSLQNNPLLNSLSSSTAVSHLNSLWRFGTTANSGDGPSLMEAPCCAAASLELEALAAVQQISNAVKDISVSEMLPRTSQLIFVNVTTWEGRLLAVTFINFLKVKK